MHIPFFCCTFAQNFTYHMKKALFYIFALVMFGSCTKTGYEIKHYVNNATNGEITVAYTLNNGLQKSSAIKAQTTLPLTFPQNFSGKSPYATYSSFYVLNGLGDTIMNALPASYDDLGNWTLECEVQKKDIYTIITIYKYTLNVE